MKILCKSLISPYIAIGTDEIDTACERCFAAIDHIRCDKSAAVICSGERTSCTTFSIANTRAYISSSSSGNTLGVNEATIECDVSTRSPISSSDSRAIRTDALCAHIAPIDGYVATFAVSSSTYSTRQGITPGRYQASGNDDSAPICGITAADSRTLNSTRCVDGPSIDTDGSTIAISAAAYARSVFSSFYMHISAVNSDSAAVAAASTTKTSASFTTG